MLDNIMTTDEKYYMNTFGKRLPVVFDHGQGAHLFNTNGNMYYDFLGGIAVNVLGHNDKELVGAISRQAEKAIHYCNYFYCRGEDFSTPLRSGQNDEWRLCSLFH